MPARGYKETPRGIFGFYDPKVLPDYIKTLYCLEKQQQFFAGMSVCFSPCPVKSSICYKYYLDEQGVVSKEYNMLEYLNLENEESSETNIYQPYTLSAEKITIDKKQVSILEDLTYQSFN